MASSRFGDLPDGRPVARHVLAGPSGLELHLLELGATVHRLLVPAPDGRRRNVVLGHAGVEGYLGSTAYLGATIGRYANRIAGGRFVVDGEEHSVPINDRGNSLHGGPDGFDRQLWRSTAVSDTHAVLELLSPAGDQGFPGAVSAAVRFDVGSDDVRIRFTATTDAPTVLNLTNHSYFNLDGEAAGSVDGHLLEVFANRYTPTGPDGIPTGEIVPVDGTPFDWRAPRPVGPGIRAGSDELAAARGLDHNFVVRGSGLRPVASLASPGSGLRLLVVSDQPGVQVYSGNYLDGSERGTSGTLYRQGAGLALETQDFPDSPNQPSFPSTVVRPGDVWRRETVWRFPRLPADRA